jgi:REP element-mobilizing transposase RayT
MRRRHWKNWGEGGQVAFVTTTALDFAHVFGRDAMKELAAASMIADCMRYEAPLYAFVVMSNHLHLVVQCPPEKTASWLVQRLKSNMAKLVLPLLDEAERAALAPQRGLNRRSLWQASFRSFLVENGRTLSQKVRYIHQNPVKAGLCAREEEYRWSSARLYRVEGMARDDGLDLAMAWSEFAVALEDVSVENSLGTGRGESSLGTGRGESSLGTGRGESSLGTGRGESSLGTGRGESSLGTGRAEA